MSSVLSLRPSYYEALKRLTLELVGVNLGSDHTFLVETRLATLARKEGFENLNALIEELFSHGQARLAIKVVSALLERDTHFNPDNDIVSQIRDTVIPNLLSQFPQTTLRVLSFGCSSGQEPYSLAMLLDKLTAQHSDLRYEVVAVDYPSPALDRAKKGLYTHFEVQRGLPIRDLVNYFERRGEDWVVKPDLTRLVSFREHHLLSSLSDLGQFHLVVFRNGLSRYASSAQIRVMRGLSKIIVESGYLMLGSQDSIPKSTYDLCSVEGASTLMRKAPKIDQPESGCEGIPAIGLTVPPQNPPDNSRLTRLETYGPGDTKVS